MDEKIDFVITWVDGNDNEWLKERNKYCADYTKIQNNRYRDWEILKYWFRAVEKNAPWVNKIYFITYGHIPSWLDTNNSKLRIVRHDEFIPQEFLPTFNSCIIELYLHEINGLSEKFVYFNDDMYINKKVTPKDFFIKGKPCDSLIFTPIEPAGRTADYIHFNCMNLINKHFKASNIKTKQIKSIFNLKNGKYFLKNLLLYPFSFITGLKTQHVATSYLKNTFKEVWEKERCYLSEISNNRFRTKNDVSQWLFQFWQIASGNFSCRKANIAKYYEINSEVIERNIKDIKKKKNILICLNDGDETDKFEENKIKLVKMFEDMYSQKSNFEK